MQIQILLEKYSIALSIIILFYQFIRIYVSTYGYITIETNKIESIKQEIAHKYL